MKKTYDRKVFKRKLLSDRRTVTVTIRLFMILLLGFPLLTRAGTVDSTRVGNREVRGKVVDEKKLPIPGVSVRLGGTSMGTATDVDGKFKLLVPADTATLVVSFIGMKTEVVKIPRLKAGVEQKELTIVLREEDVKLEDVVVTGIFTRKKESFTGSASTYSAAELKTMGTQNILQSLKTLDPAFAILEDNQFGSDPNRLPNMEIRGKSSMLGLRDELDADPNQQQAVGALAFGTESIPAVDKIVGPGNAFVAEAKKQVYGKVAIDMIAGPSEILVVADDTCNAAFVAADMLSQAEHDKLASAVLVTDSADFAEAVSKQIEEQLKTLPREEIARASIDNNGKIIITDNLKTAINIANEIAPEHLELCVDNPFDYLDSIRHAGSVFLGKNCPEALGDYFAGPNHTLPTSGTAKFSSPLSVDDFIKKYQYTYFTDQALSKVADDVAAFASAEGLDAHARSVTIRTEEK